jgi:hypothetical protein
MCLFGLGIGALLTVILVPLSISSVEYYEYGLKQRRTGSVDTSQVYTQGRYFPGPAYRFIKYQADSHSEQLYSLPVFSAGATTSSVGLSFLIDVDFTYLLQEERIGWLHEELASSYEHVILESAKVAIKNEAIFITFVEYFENRTSVETRFRDAVQRRWDSEASSLPCTLDQFNLGRVQIPAGVAARQLESRIQNEKNDRETFSQQAQIERAKTSVLANQINLEEATVTRTSKAEAGLIRAKANAQAQQLQVEAQSNGTRFLVEAAEMETQEQRTAFTYIRTLKNRNNLKLDLNYLTPENIVKTRAV